MREFLFNLHFICFHLLQKLRNGLIISVGVLPVVTTPEDQTPKAEELTLSNSLKVRTSDLFYWWMIM